MPTTEPRRGARYDSALRPVWSSPVAQSFGPSLGPVSHRLAGQASPSRPAILYDTKKNLSRTETFYSLPRVDSYKQERGGNRGTTFGPHPKSPMRPRFPQPRDVTRNAFLSFDAIPSVDKYRTSRGGESGTTFGPGLNKNVKARNLTPVNLLTANAYLNYGVSATSGSDRFPHSGSAVFGQPAHGAASTGSLSPSWRSNSGTPAKRAHSPTFGHSPSSGSLVPRTRAGGGGGAVTPEPMAELVSEPATPVPMSPEPMDMISPSPD